MSFRPHSDWTRTILMLWSFGRDVELYLKIALISIKRLQPRSCIGRPRHGHCVMLVPSAFLADEREDKIVALPLSPRVRS